MKQLRWVITLVLAQSSLFTYTAWAANCPCGTPATVFYVNGVDRSREDARDALDALRTEITLHVLSTTTIEPKCLEFELAYNHNDPFFLDFFDAASQRLGQDISRFWRFWGRLEPAPDWFQQLAQDLARSIDLVTYVVDADLQNHVRLYQKEIDVGNKVVVVAHSQGNLYANEAHNLLFSGLDPAPSNSLSIVAVATPASFVAGGGPHTTLSEDLISILVFVGARPPNVSFDPGSCGSAWDCHSFVDSYLVGITSRSKILDDTVRAIQVQPFTSKADDNFNDNSLNANHWSELGLPPGFSGTVAEVNQRLEITVGPGFGGAGIFSRWQLAGDFDIQVDYLLLNWPIRNLHSVRLGVFDLGVGPGGGIGLNRSSFPNSIVMSDEFYLLALPESKPQIATAHTAGTLRVVRTGAILSAFVRDGMSWVLVGSEQVSTISTRVNLDLGGGDLNAPGGVKVAFDNFKVNSGTVVCPRITLPQTPCDAAQVDPLIFGVPVHVTNGMVREDGTRAFQYGSDNRSFVSVSGSVISFNIQLLFVPDVSNPFTTVKLLGFHGGCGAIPGFGFASGAFRPGENIFTYNTSTGEYCLNGSCGFNRFTAPRYLWIEVWNGEIDPIKKKASYSYLVDVENPQNPR